MNKCYMCHKVINKEGNFLRVKFTFVNTLVEKPSKFVYICHDCVTQAFSTMLSIVPAMIGIKKYRELKDKEEVTELLEWVRNGLLS